MRPLILITRPEPDGKALARKLAKLGHACLLDPMLLVRPCQGRKPRDLASIEALVLTSGQALRHLPEVEKLKKKTVFAVGRKTASLARKAGFARVIEGGGTAEALASTIAAYFEKRGGTRKERLLLPTASHAARTLTKALTEAGFAVVRWHVYAAVPALTLAAPTIAALEKRKISDVLLLSAKTAKTFVGLVRKAGLQTALRQTRALCLSEKIAVPCRTLRWRQMSIAKRPTLPALLACL